MVCDTRRDDRGSREGRLKVFANTRKSEIWRNGVGYNQGCDLLLSSWIENSISKMGFIPIDSSVGELSLDVGGL
jgi:hypothetical protein